MKRCSLALLLGLLLGAAALAAEAPQALPLPEALRKAGAGKYAMLLRQIRVPDDAAVYGEIHDYGPWDGREWRGHQDLPPGHWVYVYPHWYIWRDRTGMPQAPRNWGPEQATGEPDTAEFGDIPTAWASRTPDEADEWLLLEYPEPVQPNAVRIYETYNPGAVTKVTAFKLDGEEVVVWQGRDPVNAEGLAEIPLELDFPTARIRIHLDSRAVSGWNEIDAVGLKDADGKVHWARAAEASTTYAEQREPADAAEQLREQIRRLEAEVRRLKDENERLKKAAVK
jgi:hypothetical protein